MNIVVAILVTLAVIVLIWWLLIVLAFRGLGGEWSVIMRESWVIVGKASPWVVGILLAGVFVIGALFLLWSWAFNG